MSESTETKLPANAPPDQAHRSSRAELWFCFVVLLFATPAMSAFFTMQTLSVTSGIAIIIAGALGSGFFLAKIISKKQWVFWVLGFALSTLFGFSYGYLWAYCLFHNMGHGC